MKIFNKFISIIVCVVILLTISVTTDLFYVNASNSGSELVLLGGPNFKFTGEQLYPQLEIGTAFKLSNDYNQVSFNLKLPDVKILRKNMSYGSRSTLGEGSFSYTRDDLAIYFGGNNIYGMGVTQGDFFEMIDANIDSLAAGDIINVTLPINITHFKGASITKVYIMLSHGKQADIFAGKSIYISDFVLSNVVSPLEHSFSEWVIENNATCITDGEKYRICSVCGEEETEIISALGHDYSAEFTIDKEPTDFEVGSKSRHCLRCDSVTDVTVIPKTSIANGTCGENAVWVISQDGILIIKGSGATNDYKLPNLAPWYSYADSITSVRIEEGITKLGNNSFSGLKNLSVAKFENPDTQFGQFVFATGVAITVKTLGGGNVEAYSKADERGYTVIKPENPNSPIMAEIIEISGNSVTLKAFEGYEYSIDGVTWQPDNSFLNLKEGIGYTFYQRIAEKVYAASAMSKGVTVTTLSAPEKPVIKSIAKNIAILKAVAGYEYSIDGINWQSSNVFTIPMNEIVEFYQRTAANGIYTASPTSLVAKGISVSAPKVIVSDSGIFVKATEGFEYGLEGVLWQDSPIFSEYIIFGESYIVQQRYAGADDVFAVYDEIGTTVTVNGTKKPTVINAEYFTWLRKCLFTFEETNDYAADINGDFEVDIRDLVSLKNELLEVENNNSDANETEQTHLIDLGVIAYNKTY